MRQPARPTPSVGWARRVCQRAHRVGYSQGYCQRYPAKTCDRDGRRARGRGREGYGYTLQSDNPLPPRTDERPAHLEMGRGVRRSGRLQIGHLDTARCTTCGIFPRVRYTSGLRQHRRTSPLNGRMAELAVSCGGTRHLCKLVRDAESKGFCQMMSNRAQQVGSGGQAPGRSPGQEIPDHIGLAGERHQRPLRPGRAGDLAEITGRSEGHS